MPRPDAVPRLPRNGRTHPHKPAAPTFELCRQVCLQRAGVCVQHGAQVVAAAVKIGPQAHRVAELLQREAHQLVALRHGAGVGRQLLQEARWWEEVGRRTGDGLWGRDARAAVRLDGVSVRELVSRDSVNRIKGQPVVEPVR